MKSYLLTILIFLPLLASLIMLFVPLLKEQKKNGLYRWIALISSGTQLILVSVLYMNFDISLANNQGNITQNNFCLIHFNMHNKKYIKGRARGFITPLLNTD